MTVGSVEDQIAEWRAYVRAAPAVADADVDELEGHLRDQIAELGAAGLAEDEAFLVAVKRMGDLDGLSHEFAREHSGRLWKQLVLGTPDATSEAGDWVGVAVVAVLAAVVVQVVLQVAGWPDREPAWLGRNLALLVLPFLAGWFGWRRRLGVRGWLAVATPFVVGAVVVNAYPFADGAATELLAAVHLAVVLWCAVAVAYTAGDVTSHERRMDVVRFTGEWVIYDALLALGGGVLLGLTAAVLEPTGVVDVERLIELVLPSGAVGAVVVAAWLVESKQRVIENMAPVLTMVFTPLVAVMVVVVAVVHAVTGLAGAFDRELVGVLDLLLVVVLGLVLYGMSAREPSSGPGWMDRVQLVAVVGALALDLMVLGTMVARVGELGFTPNRTAALGLNLVLLVDLAGAAWLAARFLRGRVGIHRLERWQTGYLPVFAAWAAVVVVVVPPLFRFT